MIRAVFVINGVYMSSKLEILAPVGGEEQLYAAVRCGADAVYFGLQGFNARRNADNFTDETLSERLDYCHEREVKCYITVNTLVFDSEMDEMKATVDTACGAGADALIVQDLAVAKYCRERWPGMPLFASTQMAIHNSAGVRLMQERGYSRSVLARELSLKEIKEVYDETGAELEVFVHGAHCMSVSGNCYLSAMIGGRSGNRGLCAQPCRLDCMVNGHGHALSLKDLSYVEHMAELSDAGVCSLKIEGRMKRAEYVAAAVTACREAIEGKNPELETLRAVFSRSGFTDGYLTGKRTRDMFGYRTKEDVVAAESVFAGLRRLYEKERQKIAVDMELILRRGEAARLVINDGTHSFEAAGSEPQEALNRPTDDETAKRTLGKTGGTPYYLNTCQVINEERLMLTLGQLNELRREAIEGLRLSRIGGR